MRKIEQCLGGDAAGVIGGNRDERVHEQRQRLGGRFERLSEDPG